MESVPAIIVRVAEDGTLIDVEIDGHARPTELVETQRAEPMPSFGDDEFKARVRPWFVAG